MIEDIAVNEHTRRTVIHYTLEDFSAVCVINPDGSIANHLLYVNPASAATRYNLELNRLHPAGGGR